MDFRSGRALLRDVNMKASDVLRFLLAIAGVAAFALLVVLRVTSHGSAARPSATAPPPPAVGPSPVGCDASGWEAPTEANRRSLTSLAWSPFGRVETGWETYAPLVRREIGSACRPATSAFAAAYAAWQQRHGMAADGVFKPEDFHRMLAEIELRRPFVQQTAKGLCPAAPADTALAAAAPAETYGGKPVQLREAALSAYRRMVAAARAAGVAHHDELKLVSGYRGPVEEAARCADGGCNTVTRAHCSAHRTGLAMDLYLDPAPGEDPTSTEDQNRRVMARTSAYRWLVLHADRFGFLPYPFEPWHWEWTGEPP
jgi:D-alanyl-D-alanine carboxypeptidase